LVLRPNILEATIRATCAILISWSDLQGIPCVIKYMQGIRANLEPLRTFGSLSGTKILPSFGGRWKALRASWLLIHTASGEKFLYPNAYSQLTATYTMPTENLSALVSIPASSDNPSILIPQLERPEQGKFNREETNFLKTYLPAYEALCQQLSKQGTGSKKIASVKGLKKDWVISKVFPEYVKQFSSEQNGGPQLQSLQAVSYVLTCAKIIAELPVENTAMVCESLTSSKFRFNGISYHYFQASMCH